MRGVGIVVALVLFSVLTACNKENKREADQSFEVPEVLTAAAGKSVYASAWQTLEGWEKSGGMYQARQHLPVKPLGGKVLLFARNVWAADAALEEPIEDITLQLPFNFLPYTAKPGLTENWNYQLGEDEVKIDLKVEGGEMEPRPVQVRCIYIPDEVWETLKNERSNDLAYESLVTKLNLQP